MKNFISLSTILIVVYFFASGLPVYSNVRVCKRVKAKGGLRMRISPDLGSRKVGVIPNGKIVIVLYEVGKSIKISGTTGKWTYIKLDDETGWVFGGFLEESEPCEEMTTATLSLIKELPVLNGTLKSLVFGNDRRYTIVEYCREAGYEELTFSCDSNNNCKYLLKKGRNAREMTKSEEGIIITAEKNGDLYSLYTNKHRLFMIYWPLKTKNIIKITGTTYSIPGSNFPIKRNCGN